MLKVIEKTKLWFTISTIVILIGLGFAIFRGLNIGIDFKGGTKVVIELGEGFDKEKADEITKAIVPDAVTNQFDESQYEIKATDFDSAKVDEVFQNLKSEFNLEDNALISQNEVGASVGKDLTKNSVLAVLVACVAMLIYIAIRFEFNYGIAAILALVHDVLFTISVFAVFNVPVNTPFIAAILTIIGYSINDTIVIFDRIRENRAKNRREPLAEVADRSINQTLSRSINTTLTTLITIIALNFLVPTVREFTFPLILGIAVGAYSSIFIASPILVILDERRANKNKVKTA